MDIEDVEKLLAARPTTAFYADRMRAIALSDGLELYWVRNTANADQFVIASKPKFARIISANAGHLREEQNGRVYRANEKFFAANPGFGSAIKRAIRDRTPGVVERKGEHAVMGGKVYSPISVV
jgi:hypothetical protein